MLMGSCSPARPNLCDEIYVRHRWLPVAANSGWRGHFDVIDGVACVMAERMSQIFYMAHYSLTALISNGPLIFTLVH